MLRAGNRESFAVTLCLLLLLLKPPLFNACMDARRAGGKDAQTTDAGGAKVGALYMPCNLVS